MYIQEESLLLYHVLLEMIVKRFSENRYTNQSKLHLNKNFLRCERTDNINLLLNNGG